MKKPKSKCPICSTAKGRRACRLQQGDLVCARCCAATRGSDCQGCQYYQQALKYDADRKASADIKKSRPKEYIIEIDPDVDAAVEEALRYVDEGRIAKGEAILKPLLKKYPYLYVVHYAMGTLLAVKGEYERAITFFDRSLKINPLHDDCWFNKAVAHQKIGEVGEVIKAFQKVVELGNPQDITTQKARDFLDDIEKSIHEGKGLNLDAYLEAMDLFDTAFSNLEKQNYTTAINGFNQVLQIDREHVQSHGNLGLCYMQLGQLEKAMAAFDRAIELDPGYTPALQNREVCRLKMAGEAVTPLQQTVEFYRDEAGHRTSKARGILRQLGRLFSPP